MHVVVFPGAKSLSVDNWWAPTPSDLNKISVALLGAKLGGWVRQGDQFVIIANLKLGALATKLDAELAALTADAKRILDAGGADAALRAAAFYHLRFENIHPLREGNGRVGRAILAAQLNQGYGIRPDEFLRQLHDYENEYKLVFASGQPPVMFELMVDLLAMLTGQTLGEDSTRLPVSILPLHPDRQPLMKSGENEHIELTHMRASKIDPPSTEAGLEIGTSRRSRSYDAWTRRNGNQSDRKSYVDGCTKHSWIRLRRSWQSRA